MINDPFAMVKNSMDENGNESRDKRKGISNIVKGLILQLSNNVESQKLKEINILLLNDTIAKSKIADGNVKIDKSRAKNQSRNSEYINYNYFGPPTVSITLKIWGCDKIVAEGELWQENEVVYQLQKKAISPFLSTNYFYVISED